MKISVAILNWNGEKLIEKFLPTVLNYSKSESIEIVVIDNNSSDNSVALLKEKYAEVKLIELDKNYGFAEGYNRGLSQLDSDYFVLLNSDIEVTPNWIEPIIDFMQKDSSIAACMPKIRSYRNKEYFEHAGACGGFIDKYWFPFCRGRIVDYVEQDKNQYDSIIDVFWATGACMFVRADLYKQYGGLDKDFFAHMEEIDMCWRLKNNGYRIVCVPQSTVYHVGGATLDYNSPRKLYLNFRNNLFMITKNIQPNKLYANLFIRMLFDGLAAVKFLVGFKFKCFYAILKAHFHFYKSFNKMYKKRKMNLKNAINFKHKEIYKGSIILKYFSKKIKTFDQINVEKFN